jgi:hypothetical protein
MPNSRAFKGLANLRSSFRNPEAEEDSSLSYESTERPFAAPVQSAASTNGSYTSHGVNAGVPTTISGKIDRRRLRKVLKTPSVSLSVEVRAELHNDVRLMLFAQSSTWIALLDDLLTTYVTEAKQQGRFPK